MSTDELEDLAILHDNPYADHPELSSLEASVLWEYAKMVGLTKEVANAARNLSVDPSNELLAKMRVVEQQMGLVLTLFKASVWSTIVTAEAEAPVGAQGQSRIGRPASLNRPRPEDESYYSDDGSTIIQ